MERWKRWMTFDSRSFICRLRIAKTLPCKPLSSKNRDWLWSWDLDFVKISARVKNWHSFCAGLKRKKFSLKRTQNEFREGPNGLGKKCNNFKIGLGTLRPFKSVLRLPARLITTAFWDLNNPSFLFMIQGFSLGLEGQKSPGDIDAWRNSLDQFQKWFPKSQRSRTREPCSRSASPSLPKTLRPSSGSKRIWSWIWVAATSTRPCWPARAGCLPLAAMSGVSSGWVTPTACSNPAASRAWSRTRWPSWLAARPTRWCTWSLEKCLPLDPTLTVSSALEELRNGLQNPLKWLHPFYKVRHNWKYMKVRYQFPWLRPRVEGPGGRRIAHLGLVQRLQANFRLGQQYRRPAWPWSRCRRDLVCANRAWPEPGDWIDFQDPLRILSLRHLEPKRRFVYLWRYWGRPARPRGHPPRDWRTHKSSIWRKGKLT